MRVNPNEPAACASVLVMLCLASPCTRQLPPAQPRITACSPTKQNHPQPAYGPAKRQQTRHCALHWHRTAGRPTLLLVCHQPMLGFLGCPARCDRSAAQFGLIGSKASHGKGTQQRTECPQAKNNQATESALKPQKELGESTGVDIRRQRSSRATMDGMVGS